MALRSSVRVAPRRVPRTGSNWSGISNKARLCRVNSPHLTDVRYSSVSATATLTRSLSYVVLAARSINSSSAAAPAACIPGTAWAYWLRVNAGL